MQAQKLDRGSSGVRSCCILLRGRIQIVELVCLDAGTVSPFCAPEDGSRVGKADAAWHEGDTPMLKQAAPSSARSQLTSQLASNASNNSQARGPPAEVETRRSAVGKENVEATRLKSPDTQAPKLEGALAGQREPQGPSAQTVSKPPMSAVRNDSAHEALSSDRQVEHVDSFLHPLCILGGPEHCREWRWGIHWNLSLVEAL